MDVEPRLPEEPLSLFHIGAQEADQDGHGLPLRGHGQDDAFSDVVTAGYATEDVHENPLHVGVLQHQAHRVRHALWICAAADVQEVGRLESGGTHGVHGGHGQASAVHQAAHIAV